jgi:hypothetical protein
VRGGGGWTIRVSGDGVGGGPRARPLRSLFRYVGDYAFGAGLEADLVMHDG